MSNEIELYKKLNTLEDFVKVGEWVAKCGAYGCDNVQAGTMIVVDCHQAGISLHQWHRIYDLVKGKPRKKALASLAEFVDKGGDFDWRKTGDEPAAKPEDRKAVGWFKNKKGRELVYEYSLADAIQEQLVKPDSRYVKRPGNMLRARVITNALGMLAPEIFAGYEDDSGEPASINLAPVTPSPAVEPKPVTQPASQQQPKPEAKSDVIDVKAEVIVPPPPVVVPPTTQAQTQAQTQPTIEKLSPEIAAQVGKIIGEHGELAYNWFLKQGWLTEGQTHHHLTAIRAARIIKQADGWLRAIGAVIPAQPTGEAAK